VIFPYHDKKKSYVCLCVCVRVCVFDENSIFINMCSTQKKISLSNRRSLFHSTNFYFFFHNVVVAFVLGCCCCSNALFTFTTQTAPSYSYFSFFLSRFYFLLFVSYCHTLVNACLLVLSLKLYEKSEVTRLINHIMNENYEINCLKIT
jgi:hypothetical protein